MARLVEMPIDAKGKQTVLIEVSDDDPPAAKAGAKSAKTAKTATGALGPKLGAGDKVVREAGRNLEDALKDVAPAIDALHRMALAVSKPKEISLEIGLKLSAKAGVILASADAEGSLKVTLKWVN
jgi:hypothetical protein